MTKVLPSIFPSASNSKKASKLRHNINNVPVSVKRPISAVFLLLPIFYPFFFFFFFFFGFLPEQPTTRVQSPQGTWRLKKYACVVRKDDCGANYLYTLWQDLLTTAKGHTCNNRSQYMNEIIRFFILVGSVVAARARIHMLLGKGGKIYQGG